MSRLIRVSVAAALAAAAFTPVVASAAPPCEVTLRYYYVGGTTWTARVGPVPEVHCTP